MNIGFIGAGNMATAMITGALQSKKVKADNIWISNRSQEKLDAFQNCHTTTDNCTVASNVDILVLSIKPQVYEQVLQQIQKDIHCHTLVVSIAPNWTLTSLQKALQPTTKIVRIMPNTPAMVLEGMSAFVCNENCDQNDVEKIQEFCSYFGVATQVKEEQMDAVVALSGSSPAYAFSFLNAMIEKGQEMGMSYQQSKLLAAQSLKGAASLILQSDQSASVLKQNVCSPGGTTIEAVTILDDNHFESIIQEAMEACKNKAEKMKV